MGSKPENQLVVAQIPDLSTKPVANLTHGLNTIERFYLWATHLPAPPVESVSPEESILS